MRWILLAAATAGTLHAWIGSAYAWTDPKENRFSPSFNDFGTTGLLQMPNGRSAEDGTLSVSVSRVEPYRRLSITLQALPWLQGTFRYTDVEGHVYGLFSERARRQTYKDKGVDVKVRLVKEGPNLPEISVGLRDIGGTGLFSAEYLALSRRYYDLDFTLGMGWGNMGTRGHMPNPFSVFGDGMKRRTSSDTTGQILNNFFRGDSVALFGGVEWYTPIHGLRLKLEYDGNNYSNEFADGIMADSPFNVGAAYGLTDWLTLSAGYERGNTVMVRAQMHANLNTSHGVPNIDEKPPLPAEVPEELAVAYRKSAGRRAGPGLTDALVSRAFDQAGANGLDIHDVSVQGRTVVIRLANARESRRVAASEMALTLARVIGTSDVRDVAVAYEDGRVDVFETDRLLRHASLTGRAVSPEHQKRSAALFHHCVANTLKQQDMVLHASSLDDLQAYIVFSQELYANRSKSAGRAGRAMALCAPPDITTLQVIEVDDGLPISRMAFLRRDVEGAAKERVSADEAWNNIRVLTPVIPETMAWTKTDDVYPDVFWRLSPKIRQNIGGPDNFYFYQIYALAGGGIRPIPGLTLAGNLGIDVVNNFDSLEYLAPSRLPRVRTYVADYLKTSSVWLNSLYANYAWQIAPEWYGSVKAGLFEMMYGGLGGEVMYRPTGARWAVSANLNRLWQRDFEGKFGFRDYDVTTGHVTWYHDLPWWNLRAAVSMGRYLAGDIGGTLGLEREFDNGTRVGVWATKTDVSAEEFGEGSFDKGFYVSMPFDLFGTTPRKSRMAFTYRPLMRDGGQQVSIPMPLDATLRDSSTTSTGWRDVWE